MGTSLPRGAVIPDLDSLGIDEHRLGLGREKSGANGIDERLGRVSRLPRLLDFGVDLQPASEGTMGDLPQIPRVRRSGQERFHDGGRELGFGLLGFWQWSTSDVVSNATRVILAEYLVAQAIGAADDARDEWATYDLLDPRGVAIEVKSAAYLQSWHQAELSSICFSCGKTLAWDPETNQYGTERRRHAQVYVFALLAHKDKATLDPLDVSQWEFYVVPTVVLDERKRSQDSITLASLRALHGEAVKYSDLARAIEEAAATQTADGEAKADPGT